MKLFRLFLVTRTITKTIKCNSHKENCQDFLISDWILRKAQENFPLSAQTCDHFKDEGYYLLNFVQNSITDTLQIHESE